MFVDEFVEAVDALLDVGAFLADEGELFVEFGRLLAAVDLKEFFEFLRVADKIVFETFALAKEGSLLAGEFGVGEVVLDEAKVEIEHEVAGNRFILNAEMGATLGIGTLNALELELDARAVIGNVAKLVFGWTVIWLGVLRNNFFGSCAGGRW